MAFWESLDLIAPAVDLRDCITGLIAERIACVGYLDL
jgi:hypothetical protein